MMNNTQVFADANLLNHITTVIHGSLEGHFHLSQQWCNSCVCVICMGIHWIWCENHWILV